MKKLITLVSLLLLAKAGLCHFQLIYPFSRGYDIQKEATAPCGGFDSLQPRIAFPLEYGFVVIASAHQKYNLKVNVLQKDNPTTADFIAPNMDNVLIAQIVGNNEYNCLSADIPKSVQNGTLATIQVVYGAEDGEFYQCTDVILVDVAPQFNTSICSAAKSNDTPSSSFSPINPGTSSQPTSLSVAQAISGGIQAQQAPWMIAVLMCQVILVLLFSKSM